MDTGASSHMSSNAGKLNSSTLVYNSPPIIVGNGTKLPVTHRASTHIPTTRSPLSLPNVLVSPSLVKNLISVCSLTRDNNVSVEFDAFGFSVKDLPTRSVILRCNSDGELYPLASSPPEALTATSTPEGTRCSRLFLALNSSPPSQPLVKPVSLASMFVYLFQILVQLAMSHFRLFMLMFGPLQCLVSLASSITLC